MQPSYFLWDYTTLIFSCGPTQPSPSCGTTQPSLFLWVLCIPLYFLWVLLNPHLCLWLVGTTQPFMCTLIYTFVRVLCNSFPPFTYIVRPVTFVFKNYTVNGEPSYRRCEPHVLFLSMTSIFGHLLLLSLSIKHVCDIYPFSCYNYHHPFLPNPWYTPLIYYIDDTWASAAGWSPFTLVPL